MSETLKHLILALLTIIRDQDGNATKTKLLKLLYLADIEHFRDTGKLLTDAGWVFHLYGPWFEEYDATLQQLAEEDAIAIRQWAARGLDGFSIEPRERATLDDLGLSLSAKLAIQEAAETWAYAPTGELLNHVYFHTEPMQSAERGKPLDFRTVRPRKEMPFYNRVKSGADEKAIHKARRKLREALTSSVPEQANFTPPRYDEQFFNALSLIQDESE